MYRNVAARVSLAASAACFLMAGATMRAGEIHGGQPPTVAFATRHGRSAPLRDFRTAGPVAPKPNREIHNEVMPKKGSGASRPTSDAAVQRQFGLSQPSPQIQFEGASDQDNAAVTGNLIVPPDTEGDVGPNHYIQYINNVAVIYDKTGNIVLGPFKGNAFWAGLGGPCEIQNDGDPLVRYDRMADRWVFSQFALPNFPDGPFYQCFAVSTSSDPTGDYYQYEFKTSDTFFTDYGKLGIWPDAYYMSFNMFGPERCVPGRRLRLRPSRHARRRHRRDDRVRHGPGRRRAAVRPGRADAAAGRRSQLLHDLRDRSRATAPVAVPRGLDDAREQHVHRTGRDSRGGFHLSRLRRAAGPVRSPARFARKARDPPGKADVSPGLPELRRPRVARRQPHGRHRHRRRRRAVVRDPQSGRRARDLPAGDVRPGRELSLDGLDRDGPQRQHRARLLQVEPEPCTRRSRSPGGSPATRSA